MKYSARKIIPLVLTLVLICLCAPFALATVESENPIIETHGNTDLMAYLDVGRYTSTSAILFDPDTSEVQSASIRVVYDIYYRRTDNTSLPGSYFTTTGYTNSVDANRCYIRYYKSIDSNTYYGIASATATFYAKIVGTNSSCEFTPNPVTVSSGIFD